jgi:hypothetical protein
VVGGPAWSPEFVFSYACMRRLLDHRVGAGRAFQIRAARMGNKDDARLSDYSGKFSVRDFGMSICEPADILRGSVLGKNT